MLNVQFNVQTSALDEGKYILKNQKQLRRLGNRMPIADSVISKHSSTLILMRKKLIQN